MAIMGSPLREAREVLRARISKDPDPSLFRQHLAHRVVHRDGAFGAAPQAEGSGDRRQTGRRRIRSRVWPPQSLSLQDHFLNSLRRAKLPVTIFLVKGVKLQGVITWFDAFSLLLRREGASQLVYKHSISTIMPSRVPPDFVATPPVADGGKAGLQDLFLAAAAREHERMTLFLVNGVMLQGRSPASTNSASCSSGRPDPARLQARHLDPPAGHALNLEPSRSDEGEASPELTFRRQRRERGRTRRARGDRRAGVAARRLAAVGGRAGRGSGRAGRSDWRESWRHEPFRVRTVRPATLLGKGQVEEIAEIAKERTPGC